MDCQEQQDVALIEAENYASTLVNEHDDRLPLEHEVAIYRRLMC